MADSVHIYFWQHHKLVGREVVRNSDELKTRAFVRLSDKVKTLYCEMPGLTDEEATVEEHFYNAYSLKGELLPEMKQRLIDAGEAPYRAILLATHCRLVFERTGGVGGITDAEFMRRSDAAFTGSFDAAVKSVQEYMEREMQEFVLREQMIAGQVRRLQGDVGLLIGAGHRGIEELFKPTRTELYYPYADFPIAYQTRVIRDFMQTGKVDQELFGRHLIELTAYRACRAKDVEVLCRAAHALARALSVDQVRRFQSSYSAMKRLGLTDDLAMAMFYQRENLATPQEVVKRVESVGLTGR